MTFPPKLFSFIPAFKWFNYKSKPYLLLFFPSLGKISAVEDIPGEAHTGWAEGMRVKEIFPFNFAGDFSCELELPPQFLRCSCSFSAGTYGALPKNTHHSPTCRAWWLCWHHIARNPKIPNLNLHHPVQIWPQGTAGPKAKVGKSNSTSGLSSFCWEQSPQTFEESFLSLEQIMEWWAPGKRRRWITLYNSQIVLSRVIHVIHLQLTSSFPNIVFFSAWRSRKGFSPAEKMLKMGWGEKKWALERHK